MELTRKLKDSCPGEDECARTKNRPIFQAIKTKFSVREIAKIMQDPPRELVENCCQFCPLFPTKQGQEGENSVIIEATNAGLHLERILDKGLGGIVFRKSCPSPRKIAAWEGILNARAKSESETYKEMDKESNNSPKTPMESFE